MNCMQTIHVFVVSHLRLLHNTSKSLLVSLEMIIVISLRNWTAIRRQGAARFKVTSLETYFKLSRQF